MKKPRFISYSRQNLQQFSACLILDLSNCMCLLLKMLFQIDSSHLVVICTDVKHPKHHITLRQTSLPRQSAEDQSSNLLNNSCAFYKDSARDHDVYQAAFITFPTPSFPGSLCLLTVTRQRSWTNIEITRWSGY